jgi:hypothetical protein
MNVTYFVSGRSLENWRAKGHKPPVDAVHTQCAACRQTITLSPEGAARITAATTSGDRALPVCTLCAMLIVSGGAGVEMTNYCAEQVGRSADAKATLDAMLNLAAEKAL